MSTGAGPLNFNATLTVGEFEAGINRIENSIRRAVSTTRKETDQIDQMFKKLGGAIGGYFALNELTNLATKIVTVRGEFQQLEIAFTTMLKSKAKADALMGEIADFAAKTPFDLSQVATGTKQLLAYGSSAKTVISEISRIGDIAAGVSAPLNDLIYLYGTLRTQGRAYATDIRQFAGRGIPIYEELAKVLKINTSEVSAFVEAGKVGFKEVEQAFINMTSAGGIFEGLTEKQSKSLTGLVSNFKDALDRMFNDMGKSQEGTIAEIIKGATSVVDNYEEVVKILKVLVATYGAYKAAVIATAIIQSRSNIVASISAFVSLAKSIRSAADAQALLNLVTGLNPYVAIAAAVTALVVGYNVLSGETKELITANSLLAEANKEVNGEVNKQKSEISSLISVMKNQNVAESVRLEAYDKIKQISPDIIKGLSFEAAKTADLTKEVNNYINSLERRIRLEANSKNLTKVAEQKSDIEKQLAEAQKERDALEKKYGAAFKTGGVFGGQEFGVGKLLQARDRVAELTGQYTESIIELNKVSSQYSKDFIATPEEFINAEIAKLETIQKGTGKLSKEYKTLEDEINRLRVQKKAGPVAEESFIDKLAKAEDFGRLNLLKSLQKTDSEYEAYIKKIENKRGSFKQGSKEYNQLNSLLIELKKQQKSLTSGEAPAPFGSIAYWKEVSEKAGKAIERFNPFKDNQAEIKKQQDLKVKAEAEVEKLTKQFAVKTFDETLEEKKTLYEQYDEWVRLKGKDAATKDYAELLKSGESYKAFIDREIATLEAKVSLGTANNKDRENLLKLKSEDVRIFEQGLEQKKKQYELYNSWITTYSKDSADKQFSELVQQGKQYTDYLQNQIQALEAKIAAGEGTPEDKTRLVKLKTTFYYETNGLEKYKQGLTDAADQLASLTERLEFFRKEQEKLGSVKDERTVFVAEQIVDIENQRKQVLKSFIIDNNINEAKRLEITNKYKDLRLQAEKEFGDKKSKIYKDTIDKINLAERDDFESLDNKLKVQTSRVQAELASILSNTSEKEIKSFIDSTAIKLQELNEIKSSGKKLTDTEIQSYITLTNAISQAKVTLNNVSIEKYQKLLTLLGHIGVELSGLEGKLGEVGRLLSESASKGAQLFDISKLSKTSSEASKVAKSLKEISDNQPTAENIKAAEDAMQAFKGATKDTEVAVAKLSEMIIKEVVSSWIQQKKMNDELNRSRINYQKQYNALLLEEIRLNTIKNEGFVKNYKGIVNDALQAGFEAQKQLQGVFDTLDKTLGVILKHHSGFFGLGGFDDLGPIMEIHPELVKTVDGVKSLNIEVAELLINSGTLSQFAIDTLKQGIELQKIVNESAAQIDDIINNLVGDIGGKLQSALVTAFDSGADAALAFKQVVEDVIYDVTRKLLFSALFQDSFDSLKADFKKSFGIGGDFSIVDDMQKFFESTKGLTKTYEEQDKLLKEMMQQQGFNTPESSGGGGLQGSSVIKGVTEETATALEGQFNALRITGAAHLEISKINLEVSRSMLLGISKIAVNSDYLKYLENMDKNIKKMSDSGNIRT